MALNRNGSVLFAIFAMILLAFLGIAMVSMFTTTSAISSKGFNDIRAFYLAQSGKEIAITECLVSNRCQNANYKFNNGVIKVRIKGVVPLYHGRVINGNLSDILNRYRNLTLVYTMTSEGLEGKSKREIEFKFWVTINGGRWR